MNRFVNFAIGFFCLVSTISLNGQTSRDSITVYFFLLEDCKICEYYTPTLKRIYEKYKNDSVSFIGYFPNRFSSEKNIVKFQKKHEIPFDLKLEFFQTKTKKFDVTITPEVVVYNESKGEIIYKGRIDNSYYGLGKRRRVVTSHDLVNVLESLKSGMAIDVENTKAVGCLITKILP